MKLVDGKRSEYPLIEITQTKKAHENIPTAWGLTMLELKISKINHLELNYYNLK